MNQTSCLHSELEDIGEKIVERCGGVLLAIVVTAGLLLGRERRNDRWNEVLKSMGSHQDDAISNTLALSYKDLFIELKPCFLYFGLFPEDYEVFTFQLINTWVAEKFINVVGSQTLEEVGEAYLNNLIARNLIQVASREADGRIRSCRIHDHLRTLCNSMAKENDFYDTCNDFTSISAARVRRLSTHGLGGISEWAQQTPKLRSFLFFNGNDCLSMKQVKNLCKTSRFLRMPSVDIVGGIRTRVSLPNEIGNLIHLSYLEIRVTGDQRYLIFPNTISNLKSLLTLEVQGNFEIICLPACLWKMKQLRHILIPDAEIKDLDEVLLPNLQTLKVYNGVYLLKAKGFGESTSLRLLDIGCCSENNLETPASNKPEFDLSNCQNLFDMCLRNKLGKLLETNKFPPNLTKLTFILTNLEEDPMKSLGKLSKLKILLFGRDSYKGTRMVCSRDDFPQLQVLELSSLPNLEELMVEEGGMPHLHKLIIRCCYPIPKLPSRLQNMNFGGESLINESSMKTTSRRSGRLWSFFVVVDSKEEEIKQRVKRKGKIR